MQLIKIYIEKVKNSIVSIIHINKKKKNHVNIKYNSQTSI